ncbi:uncharacterized protein LOC125654640 [Ostrea edulis]|uniref:uncharacterized protein LOC125654640 n=1 Tax=Ostrea edulis TaxID=37623 RepID=UPI0024AF8121|nr:uncharacterized protein LOC125654640 [Ostrea edulis]
MTNGKCIENGTRDCNENFFGENCEVYCNKSMRHGKCNENGTFECIENYFGENCGIFCHKSMINGKCFENGTRKCNEHFFGENCEVYCNKSMRHGQCNENGTFECIENHFGENCGIFCNKSMKNEICYENGIRECYKNHFGENCETVWNKNVTIGNHSYDENYFENNCLEIIKHIAEAIAIDRLSMYLKCYAFICQRNYENICDIVFDKMKLKCTDALTRRRSDLLWLTLCSGYLFKNCFIDINNIHFNVSLLFRGNLTESGIPQVFQNLSNMLGCVQDRFNYNIVSVSAQRRKSEKFSITTLAFNFACNNSLMTQSELEKYLLINRSDLDKKFHPPIILKKGSKQIQQWEQDWLTKHWKLTTAILGAVSISLIIVLVAEVAKMRYRKLQ